MPFIRLAAVAVNTTPVDFTGNLDRTIAAIAAARDAGARLLCLPELCLSGYGCEDLHFAEWVRAASLDSLRRLLPHTSDVALTVGLPLMVDGRLYNAAAVIADERLLGLTLKQHMANDGLHYETRWFHPWPAGRVGSIEFDGETVPVGDLVYSLAGVGVGVEVCRDAWVGAERTAVSFAERGVSVVLNPSASHFAFAKQKIRRDLALVGAALVSGVHVFTNLLGNESGRSIYDGGGLIAEATVGSLRVVAEGPRLAYADHTLCIADVVVKACASDGSIESTFHCTSQLEEGSDSLVQSSNDERNHVSSQASPLFQLVEVCSPELTKHEEFGQAAALGLFDYLRKSGAGGFVLSLSGGADSAACAVLVWLMAHRAINELGVAGFAERLPRVEGLASASDAQQAVGRLLTTLYQGASNSSETTRNAAAQVAAAVGAEHHEWRVDGLVDQYTQLAERAIGRELTWEHDDLALQNIQSRARSPGVWMLANLQGRLLLTTGNRSEASVGYATMDGDTSGGLAPLSGVDKAYLREWLRWMETEGPAGIGPLPALAAINAQHPTAELRPPSDVQTDEADLMPYDVLDAIERALIVRMETPDQAVSGLAETYPQHDAAQIAEWVGRFRRLWRGSQWKRERMAPGFHLDTHSVDSRGYRRWPILSGEW